MPISIQILSFPAYIIINVSMGNLKLLDKKNIYIWHDYVPQGN